MPFYTQRHGFVCVHVWCMDDVCNILLLTQHCLHCNCSDSPLFGIFIFPLLCHSFQQRITMCVLFCALQVAVTHCMRTQFSHITKHILSHKNTHTPHTSHTSYTSHTYIHTYMQLNVQFIINPKKEAEKTPECQH